MTENYEGPLTDETILPFMSALTAAKIFGIIVAVVIILFIVRAVVYKRALNLRRGPAAEVFNLITAVLFNTALYTFFYWQWALPVSVVIALVYMSATSHEVKEGNNEAHVGVWGLNKDIRSVRSDIFNEMSVEEQLAYTANVKEYKFYRVRFVLLGVLIPLAIVAIWYFSDIGFLFFPVKI